MFRKKKRVIILIFLLLITGIVTLGSNLYKKNQSEVEQEIQTLYRRQNQAFDLSYENHDNRTYYHGADELEMSRVIIDLHVFNSDQTNYYLTEDCVINYFSEEYDSDGNLMVYQCPEEISVYIEWWFHGGDKKIDYYVSDINKYLREAGYDKNIYDMDENDVKDAIEEYESYDLETPVNFRKTVK